MINSNNSTKENEIIFRICPDISSIENEESSNKARLLNEDAKTIGCMAALKKHGINLDYLTNSNRKKYIDIIDPKKSETVLEIGSSMGQHTRDIARKCKFAEALEVVQFQAEFCKTWLEESGINNVRITAGGGEGHLPYDDDTFDVVISNYVLEWSGSRASEDPMQFHKMVLSEIFRVLKPRGRLYLSTKNRYALKYILGSVDEHLGINFGSALPRWAQRHFAKPENLPHPLGFLHSWGELKCILKSSGFKNLKPLLAFPDARFPLYIGDVSDFDVNTIDPHERKSLSKKDRATTLIPSTALIKISNSIVYLAYK